MLILAFDTSAKTASVALLENDIPIASSNVYGKLTHSENLLPMIDSLFKFVGKSVDDVELIALSAGPGSFTGVRIGVSCAKGLAYSANTPIAPVSTLEALSYNLSFCIKTEFNDVIVCPCMDARRNELYNALFSYNGNSFNRLTPDRAISCENLADELKSFDKKVFLLGDGAFKMHTYLETVEQGIDCYTVPDIICMQNAQSVGKLGYLAYVNGNCVNAENLVCTYLRPSQAERNLKGESV